MNALPIHPASSRGRSRMRLFLGACAAALAAATAMVAAPGIAHAATCSNQTGTNNGYYYQMWSAGQGSACITVGSGGNSYSTTWSGIGDFVAGVGWSRAATRRSASAAASALAAAPRWPRSTAGRPTRWSSTTSSRTTRLAAPPGTYMGTGHQRRRHVQHLRAPAGQPALHHRATAHLRAVPGDPDLAGHQRDDHHAELLQRVGQPRDEPGLAQLPDLRDRGLGRRQRQLQLHRQPRLSAAAVAAAVAAAAARRRCRPGRRAATGTTSTSRSPAPAPGPSR